VADVVAIRVKAYTKQAKKALKSLGGSLDSTGKASVAAGVAFAAAGAAIIAMGAAAVANAKGVARMGDEIAKTARIVGVSGEQFQVLRFAAERSGVAMGSVTNGMKRLARSMFDAQRGSKQIKETFDGMGIAFEDSNGELRDSFDVLKDVADRMKTLGVTSRTTAEAQVVLGRSGADLTNLLLGGSSALVGYEDTLRSLNGVMSDEALAASEAYADAMTDLEAAITGVKTAAAEPLIPVMTELTGVMTALTAGPLRWLGEQVGFVSSLVAGMVLQFAELIGLAEKGATIAAFTPDLDYLPGLKDSPYINIPEGANEPPGGGGSGVALAARAAAPMRDGVYGDPVYAEQESLFVFLMEQDDKKIALEEATQANLKAMRDKALEESKQRAAAEAAIFQATKTAQVDAVKDVLSSVETFANLAQTAVEDSYFGQTAAGRKAAKALFVAGKAAALANAIVNTAQSITNALAVQPYPLGAALAVSAGAVGASQIGTIVGTTIQGLADAGLAPGALRDAGLSGHTAIAISPGEAVIDPVGTAEISRMLALQRRQMEMAAQGGANGGPIVVVAELDGRRVSRGLSGPMTADLEDGHDFRRNTRMEVG